MKIELKKITVKELSKGYVDNAEEGVLGYNGKLDIRPPYQREFFYQEQILYLLVIPVDPRSVLVSYKIDYLFYHR